LYAVANRGDTTPSENGQLLMFSGSDTGETVSLHAGAHPPRPSRTLHPQAASDRGELFADGQYASSRTTANLTTNLTPNGEFWTGWCVISLFFRFLQRNGLGNVDKNLTVSAPPGDHTSVYKHDYSFPTAQSRSSDEYRRGSLLPAANAAEVLAQLHHPRPELAWEQEHVSHPGFYSTIYLYALMWNNPRSVCFKIN
jgi:hypothetical protein